MKEVGGVGSGTFSGIFVWSDELALLLIDEGEALTNHLRQWIANPIAYRLPEYEDALSLAKRLLAQESVEHRRAS